MRTTTEIVEALLELRKLYLESPQHYAPDASAMESLLILIDEILDFVTDTSTHELYMGCRHYTEYLFVRGLGASRYTSRSRESRDGSIDDAELLKELAHFWIEYLEWKEKRVRPT